MEQRLALAKCSLQGLAIGDAFGQSFFAPPHLVNEMLKDRVTQDGPWYFTDDTVMAISIVEELAERQSISQDSLAKRFAERYMQEPNRGYGAGAHAILRAIHDGHSWQRVSQDVFEGQGSMGNGAAMRSGPIGAFFWDQPQRIVEEAVKSAKVTHMHPEGIAGAVAIALAAGFACSKKNQVPPEGKDLLTYVLDHMGESDTRSKINKARELPMSYRIETAVNALGNGEKILATDTVPFALWCAARGLNHFEDALWNTVSGLGDRDTTCAMVGSILACYHGQNGIPQTWIENTEALPQIGCE